MKWNLEKHTLLCSLTSQLLKAFDRSTLSFDILLQKLNYYGIAGVKLKLLANYLRNRKQYVVFNNINSEITDIRCGVPQGSILGPLFFSICINDFKNASNKCKFLMYADDTTIYFNIEDFDTNNLEAEINTVFSHCHRICRDLNLRTISSNFIIQIFTFKY